MAPPDGGGPSVSVAREVVRRRDGRSREARSERAAKSQVVQDLKALLHDFDWSLSIPGKHYSGGTNNDVLEWRKSEGRDFAADTSTLRRRVLTAVLLEFEGRTTTPSPSQVKAVIADTILEWVVKRVEQGGIDVDVPALTARYAAAKKKAGFGSRPVGVRTARWLMALESKGRVKVSL